VKRIERLAGVPQVRLAEILFVPHGATGYGVASFDLQPAGLTACRIHLPPGQQLVQASVGGKPALISRIAADEFEIALHHDQLAQHIEVLFAMTTPAAPGRMRTLESPALVQLPIERTLWTIATPDARVADADAAVDAQRAASLRIRNASALLESAASQNGDSAAEHVDLWLRDWRARQREIESAVARAAAEADAGVSPLQGEIESLLDDAAALQRQWQIDASTSPPTVHFDLSNLAAALHDQRESRAMYPGAAPTLKMVLPPRSSNGWFGRGLLSLAIAGTMALAWRLRRVWPVPDAFIRAPHLAGVLFGIAWWFFLAPPLVGLAIALLFSFAALRWSWPPLADQK
jgi:hypothetical protein